MNNLELNKKYEKIEENFRKILAQFQAIIKTIAQNGKVKRLKTINSVLYGTNVLYTRN